GRDRPGRAAAVERPPSGLPPPPPRGERAAIASSPWGGDGDGRRRPVALPLRRLGRAGVAYMTTHTHHLLSPGLRPRPTSWAASAGASAADCASSHVPPC